MTKSTRSYTVIPNRVHHTIDASGITLGRIATAAAHFLRGRDKPTFTPNVDAGAFVDVINFKNVRITGAKLTQKKYYHYSGYPGGMSSPMLRDQLVKAPEKVLRAAVHGMLPVNRLRQRMLKRLTVTP